MNLLIGIVSAISILFFYYFIEHKVQSKRLVFRIEFQDTVFLFLILFFSLIFDPVSNLLLWLGFSFLFFSMFDDMKTKSLNVLIPIIITLFFLFLTKNLEDLYISLFCSTFLYLLSILTKGKGIGQGDAYFMLPLAYVLGFHNIFIAFYLSLIFAFIILSFVELRHQQTEYAFTPFLMISSMITLSNWHIDNFLFFGTLLSFTIFFATRLIRKS